ncbi:MAG: S9 family peptidase [Moraxellaceae bacterium]|nr:S9 family peptidase [Pseudobdellovibrionaceae bacterium]
MKNIISCMMWSVIVLMTLSRAAQAQYSGHGADSVSLEKLLLYAAPALPVAMSNKLTKMMEVAAPGMGMLSPDKKTLYFSWKVTGQSHVWKIDGPQKFPVQVTSGADAVSLKEIAPNGKFLILSKDVNGQENPGLYKLDVKTGLMTELYRKEKVQVASSFITSDSKYLFITANDKKPDSYSTYKMNIETRELEIIYEGDGNWYVADQLNDGQSLLFVKYNGGRINEWYKYDVASRKMEPILGQGEANDYDVVFSAQKDEYIVLVAQDDFKKIYSYKNKKFKLLTDPKLQFDISSMSMDYKRNRITYEINRDGYTELKAMDAKNFKPIQLPQFKQADHVFAGSTTKDGQVTMLGIITAQSPRVSYSYDWVTGKLIQWVLPSSPEVDLSSFAKAELMYYEAQDKTHIPMFVRYPKGCKESKDCPVIVHFHGGPEAQSQPGFSSILQTMVDFGFIVVEPNVRGSDGYGKKWIDLDNGPLRENVITDIPDAATWIKNNWKNKSGRSPKIGVMGWSYGGYSTLMAMTRFAGSYDAGVALVGMSNLNSFLMNTAPYRRILRISEYGDPEKDKEALKKLSPITYVDQVKGPLMIIQGANDPRVPVGEAIQMHEIMKKKGLKSELIIFANEGHGSAKKENQILEIGNTIEFFKKHLDTK